MGRSLRVPSTRGAAIVVCLCGALVARTAAAHQDPLPTEVDIPEHLVAGGQYFDASPFGFQAYLNSIKTTRPDLFAQLAPDADRLASRSVTATALVLAGIGAGVATATYGILSRTNCAEPPITDPNFAADSAAWGQCGQNNITHMAAFGFIGAGLAAAGLIGAVAIAPSRGELMDLVNKHNRLSPQPLQLQLGYDPVGRLASAGAAISF